MFEIPQDIQLHKGEYQLASITVVKTMTENLFYCDVFSMRMFFAL